MKKGKKYLQAAEKVDATKVYSISEACALVKETSTVKFDATIDVSFRLNVDPKYADQQLRGTIVLPHGNGKTKKVLAITHKQEEASRGRRLRRRPKICWKKFRKRTGSISTSSSLLRI